MSNLRGKQFLAEIRAYVHQLRMLGAPHGPLITSLLSDWIRIHFLKHWLPHVTLQLQNFY
ncbi:unnamed protein product [Gulo gulo]|uniref:Uncharacterized protein n=1 Tax=Gulo gulo TaxID=48420 RepID=A0A9X9LUC8_GULGU|nr:unnamed protein product [Gulo gulo]